MFLVSIATHHWLPEVFLEGKKMNYQLIDFHIISAPDAQCCGLTTTGIVWKWF